MLFSRFPWQWQFHAYWTLHPPLTTPSPASPFPQSQSHWLPRRRVRWEKKRKESRICVFAQEAHVCLWMTDQLKSCRWLLQWWNGRRWQPSFFWWFCIWWWEQQSSDSWSSLTRGRQVLYTLSASQPEKPFTHLPTLYSVFYPSYPCYFCSSLPAINSSLLLGISSSTERSAVWMLK